MKLGDIVVYTPPGFPTTEGKGRFVVVGVIPATAWDNEMVWLSGISNTETSPEAVTCEEALDCTIVEPVNASLNPAQLAAVQAYQELNVPASWFTGEMKPDGSVEVIAIGDSPGGVNAFVWSFQIDQNGECATQEAKITEDGFSTGIEV